MSLMYCMYTALLIQICTSANTYTTSIDAQTGEETWTQTSADFVPTQPPKNSGSGSAYGTIRIGQVMSMEFDVTFHGPRPSDRHNWWDAANFFRIGRPGYQTSDDCFYAHQSYPAMWYTSGSTDSGTLQIRFNSGSACDEQGSNNHVLNNLTDVNLDTKHHMKISLNMSQVVVEITGAGAGKPDPYTQTWSREPTPKDEIGVDATVWFSTDAHDGVGYNTGNATFENIVITSNIFTYAPTAAPTEMHSEPTIKPSDTPTANIQDTTGQPTLRPTSQDGIAPQSTTTDTHDIEQNESTSLIFGTPIPVIIGISVGITIVCGFIIAGICFVCKRERKCIRQSKKKPGPTHVQSNHLTINAKKQQMRVPSATASPQPNRFGNHLDMDMNLTNINIGHGNNRLDDEQYLSDAQKEEFHNTVGCDHDEHSSVLFDEYLRNDGKQTPHTEGGGAAVPIVDPHLKKEPTTADVDVLMMIGEDDSDQKSDNESLQSEVSGHHLQTKGNDDHEAGEMMVEDPRKSMIVESDTPQENTVLGGDDAYDECEGDKYEMN